MRGLLFYSEDGGDMFIRNVSVLSSDYMATYPIRFMIEVLTRLSYY
jgi:hypothetical protein